MTHLRSGGLLRGWGVLAPRSGAAQGHSRRCAIDRAAARGGITSSQAQWKTLHSLSAIPQSSSLGRLSLIPAVLFALVSHRRPSMRISLTRVCCRRICRASGGCEARGVHPGGAGFVAHVPAGRRRRAGVDVEHHPLEGLEIHPRFLHEVKRNLEKQKIDEHVHSCFLHEVKKDERSR